MSIRGVSIFATGLLLPVLLLLSACAPLVWVHPTAPMPDFIQADAACYDRARRTFKMLLANGYPWMTPMTPGQAADLARSAYCQCMKDKGYRVQRQRKAEGPDWDEWDMKMSCY